MRILHLISYSIYSGPMPGVLGLIEAQLGAHHDVALAYDQVRGGLDGYEEPLEARHFPPGVETVAGIKMSPKASLFDQLRDRKRLKHFVLRTKVDVVHCHLSHDHALAVLSLKQCVPIVRTVHAPRTFRRRFCWPLFQANALIARSQAHRDQLQERCQEARVPILAVAGGVRFHSERRSPAEIETASFRTVHRIPKEATLVLNCALMKDRGQKELIDAVAEIDDVFLVLAGDGPDAPMLRQRVQARDLEKRVLFLGYLPFPELGHVYQSADLVVVAQAGNDGSARAALEAVDFSVPLLVVSDGSSLDALAYSLTTSVSTSRTKQPEELRTALKKIMPQLSSMKRDAKQHRETNLKSYGFSTESVSTDEIYHTAKRHFRTSKGLA